MLHNDWIKYQFFEFELLEKLLLKDNLDEKSKKIFLNAKAGSLNNFGLHYKLSGNIDKALAYYEQSVKLLKELEDIKGLATCLNNIGSTYVGLGEINKSLKNYHQSLKLFESIQSKRGIAYCLSNLGDVYEHQGEREKALEFYERSLTLREELKDNPGIIHSLNNITGIYTVEGKDSLALTISFRALKLAQQIGHKQGEANALNNIGMNHYKSGEYKKSLDFLIRSAKIMEEIDNKDGVTNCLMNISRIYIAQGNLKQAERTAKKSLKMAKEMKFPGLIKVSAFLLSDIYYAKKDNKNALIMYKLYVVMKDSINNQETLKATAKHQAKYEYEKQKALDDAEHDKLLAIEHEEKEKQQILTGATATGLGLVVIFLFFVFNRLRITRKQKQVIEQQKIEVESQKSIVEQAHFELEEKNQEIMDSITYAKRIQSAILPPNKVVKEYLQKSFILYKPKDIVAGDFYWLEQTKKKVLFAVADCTGHGVPGAMVSVVCNNALNRSVREHGLTDPGEILTKTREIVIQEFEKADEDVKDGMDIALCSLEGDKLLYAGANNPLWIIRNSEIIETKANKQPIGKFDNPALYNTHSFNLQKGDSLYVFSDGYVDQFGGVKGKKFKPKRFRELLLSIESKNMEEQKTILNKAFESWKKGVNQVDDVCIIGVKI